MKLKKVIALLLASVMAVSLLSACGNKDNNDSGPSATPSIPTTGDTDTVSVTTEPTPDGAWEVAGYVFHGSIPRTITMWNVTRQAAPTPDNKIMQKILDELGVTIDMELTSPDDADIRQGTMLAGGQFPDIIAQGDQRADMIRAGSMIALDSLLATGNFPTIANHVAPFPKLWWTGGDVPDGLYILPNYNRFYITNPEQDPSNANAFFLQKAVLESLGFPDLSNMTLEKYADIIETYMADNPTIDGVPTVGFLLHTNPNFWATQNMPAVLQGSPNNGGTVIDVNNNHEPRMYLADDYAYRTWKTMNDWFHRGLIDPESFSLTGDQYNAKLASGAVLGTFHQAWAIGQSRDALINEGRPERTWIITTPTFDNIPHYYAWNPTMNTQQGWGISVDAEDPAMILAFIEIMMSEYWQKILFWGIEGEDYLVGDDGLFIRTEEMREEQRDRVWQAANQARAFRDMMPKIQGYWPDGNADNAGNQPSEFFDALLPYDQMFLAAYGHKNWAGFVEPIPTIEPGYYPAWQAQQCEDGRLADRQMEDVQKEFIPLLIMSPPEQFDTIWEEYLAQVARIDFTPFLDNVRAHIDKYGR